MPDKRHGSGETSRPLGAGVELVEQVLVRWGETDEGSALLARSGMLPAEGRPAIPQVDCISGLSSGRPVERRLGDHVLVRDRDAEPGPEVPHLLLVQLLLLVGDVLALSPLSPSP